MKHTLKLINFSFLIITGSDSSRSAKDQATSVLSQLEQVLRGHATRPQGVQDDGSGTIAASLDKVNQQLSQVMNLLQARQQKSSPPSSAREAPSTDRLQISPRRHSHDALGHSQNAMRDAPLHRLPATSSTSYASSYDRFGNGIAPSYEGYAPVWDPHSTKPSFAPTVRFDVSSLRVTAPESADQSLERKWQGYFGGKYGLLTLTLFI